MARRFRNIKAWQLAHELTLEIYKTTKPFPDDERYGITSQIRRAASSVAANIVEGSARSSDADYLRFLDIAMSSLRETEYFLQLARDLNYLSSNTFETLDHQLQSTAKTLTGLTNAIRSSTKS